MARNTLIAMAKDASGRRRVGNAAKLAVGLAGLGALLGGCSVVFPVALPAPAAVPATAAQPEAIASAKEDYAPTAPPAGLARLPDPVVRALPKSPRGNRPYMVWGTRYDVLDSAEGYDRRGLASWYGTKFNGRETSSGEVYDMFDLTAAHRSLPLPSYVRVTNTDNGKSTVVRVNDRGPFHPERIIDLSYAAAVKLGFHDQGVAPVRVQAVAPEDDTALEDAPVFVRAGRFNDFRSADAAREALASLVPGEAYVIRADDAFTVRIGPLQTARQTERLTALLVFQEHAPVTVEE